MLRDSLKKILPRPVLDHVRVGKAQAEHRRMLHSGANLPQALMDGATLLCSRQHMLTLMPKNATVAEIGVAEGDFSEQILKTCTPSRLVLVDPWVWSNAAYSDIAFRKVSARFKAEIERGQVEISRGFSSEILVGLPDSTFDWVYVDAGHGYDDVVEDLKLCQRVVRPGGIIAGHDYLRWASPTDRLGVVEAVNEFMVATQSPLIYLTNQYDKHDSYAIRLNK